MYQFLVETSSPFKETYHMYEDLSSLGVKKETSNGVEYRILLEFRGQTTNWTRTVIAYAAPYLIVNDRSWKIPFEIAKYNWLQIMDSEAQRRAGIVYLPQPEIYNVNFYYQTSTTNLDVSSATKIDITEQLVTKRTIDNPALGYNDAPVSYYTEYTDNDVVDGKNNTNIQYGMN